MEKYLEYLKKYYGYVIAGVVIIILLLTFNFRITTIDKTAEDKLKIKESTIDELNLKYKATHIFDDLGNDFFTTLPPENCDLLISNPPFSQQNDIIKRTFQLVDDGLIKSFCLLLPLSTLETPARAEMYEKYIDKLSILIFKKRIKFLGKTQVFNKGCCWICYNIPALKEKIIWI